MHPAWTLSVPEDQHPAPSLGPQFPIDLSSVLLSMC